MDCREKFDLYVRVRGVVVFIEFLLGGGCVGEGLDRLGFVIR